MKRRILIAMLGVVGITMLATGCSSGPRCYGNSVYDNTINNFYMNGEKSGGHRQSACNISNRLFTDGVTESVRFQEVRYEVIP